MCEHRGWDSSISVARATLSGVAVAPLWMAPPWVLIKNGNAYILGKGATDWVHGPGSLLKRKLNGFPATASPRSGLNENGVHRLKVFITAMRNRNRSSRGTILLSYVTRALPSILPSRVKLIRTVSSTGSEILGA